MEALSRRNFIKLGGITSLGLVIGITHNAEGLEVITGDPEFASLNQFISIGTDGVVTLLNHRPEMGQGTFQSIPMILAEELDVDIDRVVIKPSAANSALYGSQMVVGSRSIQTEFEKLRKMGAAAREMLKQAAATRWGVPMDQCTTKKGIISGPGGKTVNYGDVASEASKLTPPENPPLKKKSEFTIIGQPVKRRDIPPKLNGEAVFGIDVSVAGMLYATIERSPVFLGKVKGYNKEEVLKLSGVRHVFETSREVYGSRREGVAILADTYWQATQARKALKVSWDTLGFEKVSDATILADAQAAAKTSGDELFGKGDVASAFAGATNVIEAVYETPYQAHVPMEPMNAIVSIKSDGAEFWGSTQNPNGMRTFLAKTYGFAESAVKINYTFMGGGFGRRSMTDVVEEAADLSKKSGVPVKVIWTREDDQTQGPFRQCSYNVCKAALDGQGNVVALEHKVIAQEIQNQTGPNMKAGRQLMGGINTDLTIPNLSVKGVLMKRHIPISYWRAVYHSTNPFAHECFLDEVAHKAAKDPLQFRLSISNHARYTRVLTALGEKTNWSTSKQKNVGRGIAAVERSGAYFAMLVEVERRGNGVVPVRITTVIDLGICINPDTVRAQVEGSIIMGLGASYAGLTVKEGAMVEKNFDTYPLLTIRQTPEIITHILDSDAPPDGAGEAGLPTVAPALVNAVFDLTGKRLRKLPIDLGTIS